MAKELLLYGSIWDFTASTLIEQMEEAKAQDILLRINTSGGGPEDTFGIIAKFAEHAKNKEVQVDGKAYSMGFFFLAYANKVTALDVSSFIVHRAAYPRWFEIDPKFMTEALWGNLDNINAKLRTALEAKIDTKKFVEITGKTTDELFSNENRIEISLTAEQAKEIGLVDEIITITPEINAEIQANTLKIAAEGSGKVTEKKPEDRKPSKKTEIDNSTNNLKYKDMSIDKLKAENPDLYKDICEAAVTAEKDRVGAWMAFIDVDKEAVIKGIKEGETLSETAKAEFAVKGMSAEALAKVKKDSEGNVITGEPSEEEKTKKEEEVSAFQKDVEKNLGLKKEEKEEDKK